MSKGMKAAVAVFLVVIVGLVVYSLRQEGQYRYEVCVAFEGRTHCATAAGRTPEQAIRAGHAIGCSLITSGRDENMACLDRRPTRVRQL